MKKFSLLALVAFLSINVSAQLKLTKDGFIDAETGKDYHIVTLDGKSQTELYNSTLIKITSMYNSAKDVVSKVDGEVITINASQPNSVKVKTLLYNVDYTLTLKFKDGRIRFDSPTFVARQFYNNKKYVVTMTGSNGGFGTEVKVGLFRKNGDVANEKGVLSIEDFFNNLIKTLAIQDQDEDDW